MKHTSILIRNGRVIDPANYVDEIRDIAILDDLIIDPEDWSDYEQVVDATGCIVTPGLIDFHVHVGNYMMPLGGFPDSFLGSGITTVVDAGSAGIHNFEIFRRAIQYSRINIKAYLHVSPTGIDSLPVTENADPACYDEEALLRMLNKHKDFLLGLKIRISKDIIGDYGIEPLKRASEIARHAECPLVVHTTNPIVPVNEIIPYFRKGDVYTHCYQGKGENILGENGHVLPSVMEAKKRGVIFDTSNGTSHFNFRVAEAALADGLVPDVISTDAGYKSLYKRPISTRTFSLPYTMSKYLLLGMSLNEVIEKVTAIPAELIGQPELGCLSIGTIADVTISRVINKSVEFFDNEAVGRWGHELIKPEMTIREGICVFRQIDFF